MKPEQKAILVDFGKTQYAKILRDYFADRLKELNDVRKSTSWDNTLKRQGAVEEIEKLISGMEEAPKPTHSKRDFT